MSPAPTHGFDISDRREAVQQKARQGRGLGWLYRWLDGLYPFHGPTVILRCIVSWARAVGVYFSITTLNRVMKEQRFERQEVAAVRNWVRGQENGIIYVREEGQKQPLQAERQEKVVTPCPEAGRPENKREKSHKHIRRGGPRC